MSGGATEYKALLATMSPSDFSQSIHDLQRTAKNYNSQQPSSSSTNSQPMPAAPLPANVVMSGQPGYARGTSSGTPAPRRSTRNVHAPSHIPTTITTPQPPGPAPAQYAADSIQPKQSFLPPTGLQALSTTYPSRLRTGTTLLVQPPPQHLSHTSHGGGHHREVRRATAINYAEPSDDDLDLDDDDDDGGKEKEDDPEWMGDPDGDGRPTGFRRDRRAGANRGERWNVGGGQIMQMGNSPTPQPRETAPTMMVDKSYLGMEPPSKYIFAKQPLKSAHEYAAPDELEEAAAKPSILVPIRVELDADCRIRDSFTWNMNETLLTPESFARTLCHDIDLPVIPYMEQIAGAIKTQVDEHAGVAMFDVSSATEGGEEDCRVILSLDVQINTFHLIDHIEWDLSSTSPTPEKFAQVLCADLGLTGEAIPLIAHALHEEILKHKKDAIEWGVIGGPSAAAAARSGRGGSGVGPRTLKGVWRDWSEANEFGPRLEVMSAEEMEKREMERERVARRLRRETQRFQKTNPPRRRR